MGRFDILVFKGKLLMPSREQLGIHTHDITRNGFVCLSPGGSTEYVLTINLNPRHMNAVSKELNLGISNLDFQQVVK